MSHSERDDAGSPTDGLPLTRPAAEGLFDPAREHDACGVGFIADMKGRRSHKIVADALEILCNLEHRGAVGADPIAGDGAGILIQIPHAFLAEEASKLGFTLPAPASTQSATCSCRRTSACVTIA
jgi:glutamate synthase (NADPH/NADH) large chain